MGVAGNTLLNLSMNQKDYQNSPSPHGIAFLLAEIEANLEDIELVWDEEFCDPIGGFHLLTIYHVPSDTLYSVNFDYESYSIGEQIPHYKSY